MHQGCLLKILWIPSSAKTQSISPAKKESLKQLWYQLPILKLPTRWPCAKKSDRQHAMSCKKRGFVTLGLSYGTLQGVGSSKNCITLGGIPNFLLEKGDKSEKGELMQNWGGCHFFHYFTAQPHLLCVVKNKVSFITFGSSVF